MRHINTSNREVIKIIKIILKNRNITDVVKVFSATQEMVAVAEESISGSGENFCWQNFPLVTLFEFLDA